MGSPFDTITREDNKMGQDRGDEGAKMAIDSALVRELAALLSASGRPATEVDAGPRNIRFARPLTAAHGHTYAPSPVSVHALVAV